MLGVSSTTSPTTTGPFEPNHRSAFGDLQGVENQPSHLDDEWSNTGKVFNNTMHESFNTGGSLRFRFNGTSRITVYGSTAVNLGISPPGYNITCSLDGNALGGIGAQGFFVPSFTVSHLAWCVGNDKHGGAGIGDGGFLVEEHELIINVTTCTNTHVYLDYIVYEVPPDARINGDVLRIGANQNGTLPALQDQHLIFSGRWFSNDSTGAATAYIPGSSVSMKFNGTQIQLYGEIINASSPTTAQYQVDGGPQHDFFLTRSTTSKTNQLLLNVPSLTPTEHTLTVTLGGGSDDMPLLLSYFLVTSTTSSLSPNPTSSLPFPIPAQYTSKAAIVGGVVGGIPVSDERIDPLFIAPMGERGFHPQSLISHTRHENGRRAKSHLTQGQPTSEEAETAAGLRRASSGNRRLLQRRDRERETASERLPPPHQAQGSAPIVHTDSGWRMRGERTSSERQNMSEIPPGYKET
ncbi:hypothetical protein L218DRAFT_1008042 [Marasmius fiardii PR-910]|nr:hypothetical protein L218DRAFT_1008042 [Marasmius fiardii PR-910]